MNTYAPKPGTTYKLFLVEMDDENRERVIAGRVNHIEFTREQDYADIHDGTSFGPIHRFVTNENVSVTMKLVPSENGTYFTIENFNEGEDVSYSPEYYSMEEE